MREHLYSRFYFDELFPSLSHPSLRRMAEEQFTRIGDTSIGTPGAGVSSLFIDSTSKIANLKDDTTGYRHNYFNKVTTASQNVATTGRTYLTGSNVPIQVGKLQIGTRIQWTMNYTKTGAGSASSVFDICVGTAGTTADTARVSFTKPAGTAVADEGRIIIDCVCRGPLSASGILAGHFNMTHNLSATGHAVIPVVDVDAQSAAFDVTVASLIVGLCITAGASDNVTFQWLAVEAWDI